MKGRFKSILVTVSLSLLGCFTDCLHRRAAQEGIEQRGCPRDCREGPTGSGAGNHLGERDGLDTELPRATCAFSFPAKWYLWGRERGNT